MIGCEVMEPKLLFSSFFSQFDTLVLFFVVNNQKKRMGVSNKNDKTFP